MATGLLKACLTILRRGALSACCMQVMDECWIASVSEGVVSVLSMSQFSFSLLLFILPGSLGLHNLCPLLIK